MRKQNSTKLKEFFFWFFLIFFSTIFLFKVVWADPYHPVNYPGTLFLICTHSVYQPVCYDDLVAKPTFRFIFLAYSSTLQELALQVDNNSDFSSPEINLSTTSGWILSGDIHSLYSYQPNVGLSFSTSYYWRIGGRDQFNSWSSWALAYSSFTTAPRCVPSITSMQAIFDNFCISPQIQFKWVYNHPTGKPESKYQLQIDDNSSFSSPEVNIIKSIIVSSGEINTETILVQTNVVSGYLNYNKTYYWRVKVWDNAGIESNWANGPSVTTPSNPYPQPDFHWIPNPILINQPANFINDSVVYTSNATYYWSFPGGSPNSANTKDAITKYSTVGTKNVTLQVRDQSGYTCSKTKTIETRSSRQWIETP